MRWGFPRDRGEIPANGPENGVVHISLDMARYSRIDMALSLKKVQSDQCAGGTGQPGYGGGGRFRPPPENMAQAAGVYLSQVIEDGDVLGVALGTDNSPYGEVSDTKSHPQYDGITDARFRAVAAGFHHGGIVLADCRKVRR